MFEKVVKSPQRRRLRLRTPLASGEWRLRPQTPALLPLPTAVAFVESVSNIERTLLLQKITEVTHIKVRSTLGVHSPA